MKVHHGDCGVGRAWRQQVRVDTVASVGALAHVDAGFDAVAKVRPDIAMIRIDRAFQ